MLPRTFLQGLFVCHVQVVVLAFGFANGGLRMGDFEYAERLTVEPQEEQVNAVDLR
jgi:hypothetical protein